MKISHKLFVRMDGTPFLWLWWFTAKNNSPQTFQPAVYDIDGKVEKKKIPKSKFICGLILGLVA